MKKTTNRQSGHVEVFVVVAVVLAIAGFVGYSFWKAKSSNAGDVSTLGTANSAEYEGYSYTNTAIANGVKICSMDTSPNLFVRIPTGDNSLEVRFNNSFDGPYAFLLSQPASSTSPGYFRITAPSTPPDQINFKLRRTGELFTINFASVMQCKKKLATCTIKVTPQPYSKQVSNYTYTFGTVGPDTVKEVKLTILANRGDKTQLKLAEKNVTLIQGGNNVYTIPVTTPYPAKGQIPYVDMYTSASTRFAVGSICVGSFKIVDPAPWPSGPTGPYNPNPPQSS